MSFRDARTLETSIDSTYREALEFSDENQSRLAQLMTIWVSVYVEVICKAVLLAYTERKSISLRIAIAWERDRGGTVRDVSKPEHARPAGVRPAFQPWRGVRRDASR